MNHLSETRIKRLRVQGFTKETVKELNDLKFGIRFAYYGCSMILIGGVATASIPLLSAMFFVALFGAILPNHPLDHVYNHLLAGPLKKPQLSHRHNKMKFACGIASLCIAGTIALFFTGYTLGGYILGGTLISVALTVATTDFCIPSVIWDAFSSIK